jgi:hypothetical protein
MRWLLPLVLLGSMACSSGTASAPVRPDQSPSASAAAVTDSPAPTDLGAGTAGSEQPSPSPTPTPTPSSSPIPSPTPIPSPPATQALAVLVDLFAGGNTYNLALVGVDGRVVTRAHAAERSLVADASELPYVSTSSSRVYYLDGDRNVRYVKSDGSTGLATTVPGGPRIHAAFAVTPDDARIAVALLDYSISPVKLTLYVEDLGGTHHSVIFTSTDHYVWPVAWHLGQLVVAYLGPGAAPFKSKSFLYPGRDRTTFPYGPNPYGGINFHVINPVTAAREAIISGGGASGLLTKAGTAVVQGDADDWQGNWINWNSPQDYGSFSAAGSLSPNGRMIAACCPQPGSNGLLVIWFQGGQTHTIGVTVTSIDWVGWLDDSHLVTGFYQSSDGTPSVVELGSDKITPIDAHGIVAAILPGPG